MNGQERKPIGQALNRAGSHFYTWWNDGTVTRCEVEWDDGTHHRVGLNESVTPAPTWNDTDFYEYHSIHFQKPFSFLPRPINGG